METEAGLETEACVETATGVEIKASVKTEDTVEAADTATVPRVYYYWCCQSAESTVRAWIRGDVKAEL